MKTRRVSRPRILVGLTLMLGLMFEPSVVAQEQFQYTISNGTITITEYTGPGGAVVIPDAIDGLAVTRIGERAFEGCTGLTSVTIPDSVTHIGVGAFYSCTSLTAIQVDPSNPAYSSGDAVLFNKSQTALIVCPGGKTGAYTIPDSVTHIGVGAFYGCTSLSSIAIPNSVTSIGNGAFGGCTSLSSIAIPSRVTSIGDWAFSGCASLSAIAVDALHTSYSSVDGVLFNKSQTTLVQCPGGKSGSYTIPNSVTSIGKEAFCGCAVLTSVTIPDSVTSIAEQAFIDCSGLITITFGSGVTDLGERAFSRCASLTSVSIPNSLTRIHDGMFTGCTGLTSVTIPDSVTSIGRWAFSGCTSLTHVTIPRRITDIGKGAFKNCTGLRGITVDPLNTAYSSLDGALFDKSQTTLIQCPGTEIGSYAIPNTVTGIRDDAFSGWTNLTSVTIPSSVTGIEGFAFSGCANLREIAVDPLNEAFSTVDGVLFDKSQTVLIRCPQGKVGIYKVPDKVARIEGPFCFDACTLEPAFGGCTRLTSVTIPNGVTNLGGHVFYGCTSLSGVYFEGSAPTLIQDVFFGGDTTVYYLPGSTGWDTDFSGQPTALWLAVPDQGLHLRREVEPVRLHHLMGQRQGRGGRIRQRLDQANVVAGLHQRSAWRYRLFQRSGVGQAAEPDLSGAGGVNAPGQGRQRAAISPEAAITNARLARAVA